MRRFVYVCLLVGSLLSSVLTLAQAPPEADTYFVSSMSTRNYGSSNILALQPNMYSFIRFDLSGIPANATVQKAVLRLFVNGPSDPKSGTFDVYEIDDPWAESCFGSYREPERGSPVNKVISLGRL